MAKHKKHHKYGPAPKPARTYGISAFGVYGLGGYYGGYPGYGDGGTAQSGCLSSAQFDGGAGDAGATTGGDGGGGTV